MASTPQPALATLSHDRFWREGWIYERKLDGQRCLAVRGGGTAWLYSRSGHEASTAFPEVGEALTGAGPDLIVDAEVVAFSVSRTRSGRLQPRTHLTAARRAGAAGVAVYYYVFDLLSIDGQDVRDEPLTDRKRRLRTLLPWTDPVRWTPHRRNAGEEYFGQVCA